MQRLACCVALFVFVLVHTSAMPNSRPALSLRGDARAAIQEETVPLSFDTLVSGFAPAIQGNTCSLELPQYMIQYPGGATRVKIEISLASPPTLGAMNYYARFGERVVVESGSAIADFASGGTSPLYFPTGGSHLFEAGTYFIAIRNCGLENVDYTIQAKLLAPTDADTATVSVETSFGAIPAAAPGSCSLARTQYRVTATGGGQCGGTIVLVSAISNQNINLYIRRDQRVAMEDGRIVADLASTSPGNSKSIALNSAGVYFIAVANCSAEVANYDVSFGQIVIDPPAPPFANGCSLERNPAGQFVLTIHGTNIKEGATVTVGGRTPKKIKFIELEAGSTNTYRTIRVVKKFCGGLPGNIVITNPGPCEFPGAAFFCNLSCDN